jgi:hypothetical protein
MMKSVSIVTLLAMPLALGACDRVFSDLVVRNGSSERVTDIVIKYDDGSSKLEDLEPGAKTMFNGHLPGEGAPVVLYTAGKKRFSYSTCYYTAGMPVRGEVTLLDKGATRSCR